jgi:hypothetical protein
VSGGPSGRGPRRLLLDPPARARREARRWLDPVAGWFRRLERAGSLFLSRSVFPRVPGIERIYGRILDRRLTVVEADVVLPGLGSGLDGAGVLLITDIHTGPFLAPVDLRRAIDRLLRLAPDLVLVGGDLVTTALEDALPHQSCLEALRAPLGSYAVLGNHDHYTGRTQALRAFLSGCGIQVLLNEAVRVERGGARLALAGLDDWNAGVPDVRATLAAARTIGGPILAVSHNPDAFFDLAGAGVGLVLAGHTHGGQIRCPGLPVGVRMSRYCLDEGRYAWNGAEIVVSRGLGVSGLPLRVACPPEAVFLRLRRDGSRARA